ncbi:MAG: hypothetical protein ABJE94_13870 [Parasphingorhabdus sp.]|uniref:hypothetical protein n=1 Tax=Parasphingorhabdus sp. TaxID=2709688 RepID=UPI003266A983
MPAVTAAAMSRSRQVQETRIPPVLGAMGAGVGPADVLLDLGRQGGDDAFVAAQPAHLGKGVNHTAYGAEHGHVGFLSGSGKVVWPVTGGRGRWFGLPAAPGDA